MLRINIEVTESSKRLKQIEEIVVHNTGEVDGTESIYDVYRDGRRQGSVSHYRGNGALMLAYIALDAVLEAREREAGELAASLVAE